MTNRPTGFHLAFTADALKSIDTVARRLSFIASRETYDRHGDLVMLDGLDLTNFKDASSLLKDHNAHQQMGVVEWLALERRGGDRVLAGRARIFPEGTNAAADEAWREIQAGGRRGISIGFLPRLVEPRKDGGRGMIFRASELLEISSVVIPACPTCLLENKSCGCGGHASNDDEIVLRLIDDASAVDDGTEAAVKHAIHESLQQIIQQETTHEYVHQRHAESHDEARIDVTKEELAAMVRAGMREAVNDATRLALNQLRGRID